MPLTPDRYWQRVKELRRYEMEQRALFWDYRKLPSEFGHLVDDASHEAEWARKRRADILNSIKLEHLVMFHGKSEPRFNTSTKAA